MSNPVFSKNSNNTHFLINKYSISITTVTLAVVGLKWKQKITTSTLVNFLGMTILTGVATSFLVYKRIVNKSVVEQKKTFENFSNEKEDDTVVTPHRGSFQNVDSNIGEQSPTIVVEELQNIKNNRLPSKVNQTYESLKKSKEIPRKELIHEDQNKGMPLKSNQVIMVKPHEDENVEATSIIFEELIDDENCGEPLGTISLKASTPKNQNNTQSPSPSNQNSVVSAQADANNSEKLYQSQLVQNWLDKHQQNYISHAIWEGNIGKVIKRGTVLPAEAVLKETGTVEFEKGAVCGERGTQRLIELTEDAKKIFKGLTEEEEQNLKQLKSKELFTPDELREYKNLNKLIYKAVDANTKKIIRNSKIALQLQQDAREEDFPLEDCRKIGLALLPKDTQTRYAELHAKEKLTIYERKQIKTLELKKNGFFINFVRSYNAVKFFSDDLNPRNQKLIKLFGNCTELSTFTLSYYLKNNNIVYPYLTHKFNKWKDKGIPLENIDKILTLAKYLHISYMPQKLNSEVRTQRHGIRWVYGKCVVLRGNPDTIISRTEPSGEACLLRPWENGGEYFNLDLANEDTILLGPKKDLEPHLKRLHTLGVKFGFLESLTTEQRVTLT